MVSLNIGGRLVGTESPCLIIAEACDNHFGRLDYALEMVRMAKLAGADAIKFQHHLPDEEMLPDVPMSDNFDTPLYEFLKKNALTLDQHVALKAYCEQLDILYLCTPFSWAAAQELDDINVSAFKIGSGEMTDIPTLVRIAELGKPMLISTGMSEMSEIKRTYDALSSRRAELALLNCVSEYPPVYEDINLNVIEIMKDEFPEAIIGHSDHTPDLYTSFAAVALGAKIIEKHVILDKRMPGPDQAVSIDFADLSNLVSGIRKIEAAAGFEKKVHKKEAAIREWAFRSLVTTKAMRSGEILHDDCVWSKRPGTGIPSFLMDEVIGKTLRRDIAENHLLSWDDFE